MPMSAVQSRTLVVSGTAEDVADARHFVCGLLVEWGMQALVEDAELLVSEMVTNAVRHGLPPSEVHVCSYGTGVRLEVSDTGPWRPRQRQTDPLAPGGRGLVLIESLATRWGVMPRTETGLGGKVVWCELG
jgi:anti-sigma regulatory factor (Ser/Thr protein kinase)